MKVFSKAAMRNIALVAILIAGIAFVIYYSAAPKHVRRTVTSVNAATPKESYYCPMHPSYHADKPGNCPICGMKLVPLESSGPGMPSDPGKPSPVASSPAPQQSTSNAILVPPEKQQLIGMRSVAAQMQPLVKEIRTVGKVSYDETRLTHIHTKVAGYIEQVFADFVGKPVRAGEPLFTIYSPDLVATQQEYLLALKSRNLLKQSVLPSAATGSENLLAAAHERLRLWDVTDADVQRLETEGTVKHAITVSSPVNGVVMERAAYHHGTFVDPQKDLYTIVDLSHVWILGEVFESDLPFVKTGQTAEIELPYDTNRRTLRGRVDFILPFLDPKTRTAQIRMQFANPAMALKPDMFANVRLQVNLGRQLVVPQDAVMNTGTEQYVFIDRGDGYVEPRKVTLGPQTGEQASILAGLKTGERVITAANFLIDSESRLKGAFADMGKPAASRVNTAPNKPPAPTQNLSIEILEPKAAKTGSNPVRVMVRDNTGKPVTGAEVQLSIFMPQMGSMPPMTARAALKDAGNGIYIGQIDIPMAWTWQTTITVSRAGATLGATQTTITAR